MKKVSHNLAPYAVFFNEKKSQPIVGWAAMVVASDIHVPL